MAAPTASVRGTPAGIPLLDGYQTLISFLGYLTLKFWEKTVTPPGLDGGDAIETTTMHNTTWRTMWFRSLITLTDVETTVAYDPASYESTEIQGIINTNLEITVEFSDDSTLAFWGALRLFEPQETQRGEQPEANITITPSNWDSTNNVEAGPVIVETAGT